VSRFAEEVRGAGALSPVPRRHFAHRLALILTFSLREKALSLLEIDGAGLCVPWGATKKDLSLPLGETDAKRQ
jgi:hypothetical protein